MNVTPQPQKGRGSHILSVVMLVAAVAVIAWALLANRGVVKSPGQVATNLVASGKLPLVKPKNDKAYLAVDDPAEKIDSLGPRKWKTINVHEHVQSEAELQMLLTAMDQLGVKRVCALAATTYTFTLNPIYGFEGFKENNEELIRLKKKYPDRMCAFVTLDPVEEGNLERLKDYVQRGADGLKLYLGHGASTGKGPFHIMPLDDPRMEPIWAWAEEVQLPIALHVNLIKFWDEMLRVLEKHPYLRIQLPHFGLHKNTEARLNRLQWLLKRYPNLYTDMSYGYYTFHVEGFEAFGKWRSRSRKFLEDNREKIMFASDMVLEPTKNMEYTVNTLRSYLQWLERDRFRFFYVPSRTMHGMGMDDETISWIYEKAAANFLLLDGNGNLPDRSQGWPVAGLAAPARPPIPPLNPAEIPQDTPSKSTSMEPGPPGHGGCEHEPLD